jgi:hypothetical protein
MTVKPLFLALVVLVATPARSIPPVSQADSLQVVSPSTWKYRAGDSLKWSATSYNDSSWQSIGPYDIPLEQRGIFWMRKTVRIGGTSEDSRLRLRMGLIQSACEVYWDGVLIGKNGTVGGNEKSEIPGTVHQAYPVPATGGYNGVHVLSFRCSNFHASVPSGQLFAAKLETDRNVSILNPASFLRIALLVGMGFAGGILGLMLYIAGGRFRSYLFSSLLCFALVLSKGMELLISLWNAPMTIMRTFDAIYIAGFYIAEIAILVFFLFAFDVSRRGYQVVGLILLSIPFYASNLNEPFIHYLNYDIFRVVLTPYFIGILYVALKNKRTGSTVASAAYGLYAIPPLLLVVGTTMPSLAFDVGRAGLILVPIVVSGLQVHEQQKREKEVEQEARRVRTELLTKTIQPHFLFNSLASVKSLARHNPRKADRLVEALTDEFRLLNEIMAEKEISLVREVELCNYHLKVMGIRRDAVYTLVAQNIPTNETIPPLVLHTLVENGLTHAFKPKEHGYFWLTAERSDGVIQYQLQNNGSLVRKRSLQSIEEGMGLKYVRARLEERYPGNWSLHYGMNGEKWEVLIKILRRQPK